MSELKFGIGVEDDPDLDALLNSTHPKHPTDLNDKLTRMLEYIEQMSVTQRDNNAILHQLMKNMEERINKKIDNLRTEMIVLINEAKAELGNGKTVGARRPSGVISAPSIPRPMPGNVQLELIDVTPHAGFVIKTRKLVGDKIKAFINIFHHELVDLCPPGLDAEKATDKPYLVIDAPTTTMDRTGTDCLMINVCISSEYFIQPNPKVDIIITSPSTIFKIIHKINVKYNAMLDEGNYSIPRLANGFKGDVIPTFAIPKDKDQLPSIPPSRNPSIDKGKEKDKEGGGTPPSNTTSPTGGIAAAWAASDAYLFEINDADRVHHADNRSTPTHDMHNNHNGKPHHDHDNDSVISDISMQSNLKDGDINTTQNIPFQPGQKTLRRGSSMISNKSDSGAAAAGPIVPNPNRKIQRKSVLVDASSAGYNGGAIAGRNLLSGDMLTYLPEENVDVSTANELKAASVTDPAILLGWQIWIQQDNGENLLFVVTDVRKNYLSKTEYRISRFKVDDEWVKLKRQDGKQGMDFRPMRKVLHGLAADDEQA